MTTPTMLTMRIGMKLHGKILISLRWSPTTEPPPPSSGSQQCRTNVQAQIAMTKSWKKMGKERLGALFNNCSIWFNVLKPTAVLKTTKWRLHGNSTKWDEIGANLVCKHLELKGAMWICLDNSSVALRAFPFLLMSQVLLLRLVVGGSAPRTQGQHQDKKRKAFFGEAPKLSCWSLEPFLSLQKWQ